MMAGSEPDHTEFRVPESPVTGVNRVRAIGAVQVLGRGTGVGGDEPHCPGGCVDRVGMFHPRRFRSFVVAFRTDC